MLFKSQPTALLLISAALGLGGYTAVLASVCYPAYVPGSTYAVGAWVSKSITTTSPILYTACTPGVSACPPSGFRTEGENSTTATHNYQCNSNYWCSNVGFAPGSVYSDIAWTKENPACVGTAICAYNYDGSCGSTTAPGAPFTGDCKYVKVVTTTPTPTPTVIDISPWSAATVYASGDKVRIGGATFQCKPAPFNAYCNLATYQPSLSENGLWIDAWTSSGPCQYASLAPTSAP